MGWQPTCAYLCLGVELGTEEGLALVPDPLVGAVIHVREQRLPPLAELGVVDGIPVVLGGDVALVRHSVHHGLFRPERGNSQANRPTDREKKKTQGRQGEGQGMVWYLGKG